MQPVMQLVMATHYFESHRGGVEIVAGRLARALLRLDFGVVWLASDATPAPPPAEGCGRAVVLPALHVTERKLGFPLPLPKPSALAAIWREVKAADALLIHDSLYPTNVAARIAGRLAGTPVVIVQHIGAVPYGNPVLRILMRAANRLIARPMLASADQVVFISETTRRYFASVAFRRPPRLIFNGVDTQTFRPPVDSAARQGIRRRLGFFAEAPTVLFVGRFVEKKGLAVLERLARMAPHIVFAFAGWGPLSPQGWGLSNVRVFSDLSGAALAPLYQASDVFILPSTGEGLPLVIQEALACGLPVICGAETRDADPELAGLVEGVPIDAADPAGTAGAFLAAIEATLARPAPEEAARERHSFVARRYDWSSAAAQYRDIVEDLARARMRSRLVPTET